MANQTLISGILNINKPQGITSHDVVARIRKLSGIRKVGHTGALDPMATGVLVVCLGQATRLIEYIMPGRKRYRATIRFGVTTDTLDAEGEILAQSDPSHLTLAKLKDILPAFEGEIEQTPPIFSALKRNGQPLYKAARAGRPVAVDPRPVTIYALHLTGWQPPDLGLDITCSAGTYIRSLARDLGEKAGPGAHLAALIRTANYHWLLDDAVSLNKLEQETQLDPTAWQKYLQPLDTAIHHMPKVTLAQAQEIDVKHGRRICLSSEAIETPDAPKQPKFERLRAYTAGGKFLAILEVVSADNNVWRPKKVFQV